MAPGNVLIMTPAAKYADLSEREPLNCLAIPAERIPDHFRLPKGEVWWCEKRGRHVWLRGYLRVEYATEELLLDGLSHRLVWHASSSGAERLTWPGRFHESNAEISSLLARQVISPSRDCWITEIPQSLSTELNQKRIALGEIVWSYDMARNFLHRTVLASTDGRQIAGLSGDLSRARDFARRHMARTELVRFGGHDPYDVTAAILAGYSQMPVTYNATKPCEKVTDSPDNFEFSPLKPDEIALVCKEWSRSASITQNEALERADGRHQEILRDFALILMQKGYRPTYNQFVDLRIETEYGEIFFEIKSAQGDNFAHQARLALGQLSEYRFRARQANGDKPIQLVAVIERVHSPCLVDFVRSFLASEQISLVVWDKTKEASTGLEVQLDSLLRYPSPSSARSSSA